MWRSLQWEERHIDLVRYYTGHPYDTENRRFMALDIIYDDFNRYAYGVNNPLKYVDYDGWKAYAMVVGRDFYTLDVTNQYIDTFETAGWTSFLYPSIRNS